MRKLLVIILLNMFCIFQSQQKVDSLKEWMNKFSMPVSLKVTEDGKYATVVKSYKGNIDTLLVFSNGNPKPYDTIIGSVDTSFLGKRYLFATGRSKTELLDMQSHKKHIVRNVKKAGALVVIQQYYTLSEDGMLQVFDLQGNVKCELQGIKEAISDHKNRIFMISQTDDQQGIWEWNGKKCILKYMSPNILTKLELLPSAKYMVIYEEKKQTALKSIKVLDTENDDILTAEGLQSIAATGFKIVEIAKGDTTLLVTAEDSIPVQEKNILEIWYGSDKELRSSKYGNKSYQYWLWSLKDGKLIVLPDKEFKIFTALGSSHYIWAFNIAEEFRYIHSNPVYDFSTWDTQENSSDLIFEQAQEVTGSEDGRYAVAYSYKGNRWQLYDIMNNQLTVIGDESLKRPVFTKDGKFLWFSGKTDIWSLNLQTKKLLPLKVSESHEVRVVSTDLQNRFSVYNAGFGIRTVNTNQSIILEFSDREKVCSSWVVFKKGQVKTIIPYTENKVKELWYNENTGKIYTLEENYNLPQSLWLKNVDQGAKKSQTLLYRTNNHDTKGHQLRQDIISFKNSMGIPLKALLAYPVNFNPRKKYPVIVRIYQKQVQYAGDYISPELSDDGFSKRLWLEEGYIVYQPDIIFDARGTGVAALDCVNAALDAIALHPNIDQSKIGLTGHSLGGYETNFIATKSKRFAAYVSGASVSNVLQAYFSFSSLFKVANYARFENGQFEMNTSFTEDKELYMRNDPIRYVENVTAPILLWTGRKDTNIPPEQTMAFYMGLLRNKKQVITLVYKNQAHALGTETEETKDLNKRILEWWNFFLKDQKKIEWIDKEIKKGAL